MKYCAFFCLQVRISARSDAFSGLSVLEMLDFCLRVQGQEKVVLCYDCDCDCDAGHDDFLVPFDNQRVCYSFCHHCHRKVIFLICPQVFGPCLSSESSMKSTKAFFDHDIWLLEEVWGYERTGLGSVFFEFFWGNVSERYLKVYRILLGHHHVPGLSGLYLFRSPDVEGFEIGSDCSDGVVLGDYSLHVFGVVGSWIGSENMKAIFLMKAICGACLLIDVQLGQVEYMYQSHVEVGGHESQVDSGVWEVET